MGRGGRDHVLDLTQPFALDSSPLAHTADSLVRVTRRVVGSPTRQAGGRGRAGGGLPAGTARPPNHPPEGEGEGGGRPGRAHQAPADPATHPGSFFLVCTRTRAEAFAFPNLHDWHLPPPTPRGGEEGSRLCERGDSTRFQGHLLVRVPTSQGGTPSRPPEEGGGEGGTAGRGPTRPARATPSPRQPHPGLGTVGRGQTAHPHCLQKLRVLLILFAESFHPSVALLLGYRSRAWMHPCEGNPSPFGLQSQEALLVGASEDTGRCHGRRGQRDPRTPGGQNRSFTGLSPSLAHRSR